ncbi:hypothetical protein J7643_03940 [bacterium]|nr:hypothetical protein [bacterium]
MTQENGSPAGRAREWTLAGLATALAAVAALLWVGGILVQLANHKAQPELVVAEILAAELLAVAGLLALMIRQHAISLDGPTRLALASCLVVANMVLLPSPSPTGIIGMVLLLWGIVFLMLLSGGFSALLRPTPYAIRTGTEASGCAAALYSPLLLFPLGLASALIYTVMGRMLLIFFVGVGLLVFGACFLKAALEERSQP